MSHEMAMASCRNSRVGGFNDWRLPNKEELNLLYIEKTKIGGFSIWYWSSTQNGKRRWVQNFATGEQKNENLEYKGRCRCVRNY